jgi:hypothetical protein
MKAIPPDGMSMISPNKSAGKTDTIESPSKPEKLVANMGIAATESRNKAKPPRFALTWASADSAKTVNTKNRTSYLRRKNDAARGRKRVSLGFRIVYEA